MDYGGRPDIGTILKRWGTEHEWGGGGEGQWFHTIAAAKFILRAKTLEIASAQTRRYKYFCLISSIQVLKVVLLKYLTWTISCFFYKMLSPDSVVTF